MRNFKARISKLEKNIKPRKKLYKIYWADGTFVGANIAPQAKSKASQAKALTRVLESLAEKGLINERDGFYWLPENEQTNDDNQT